MLGPTQILILKDKQLMDQFASNEIMLTAISALENLATFYGFKGPRIFDYYSCYAQTENESINAILLQLELFRNSYLNYISIYSDYHFPTNLTKEQIIVLIKEWKKSIPPQKKADIGIYYDEIIRYIKGNSNSGISNIIDKKRTEWGPTTQQDLDRIAKCTPYVNSHISNQMNNINETYNRTGKYEVKANLCQTQETNMFMNKLLENDQKYKERKKQFLNNYNAINNHFEMFFKKIKNKYIDNKNKAINETDCNSIKQQLESFKSLLLSVYLEENFSYSIINKYKEYKKRIENIISKGILNKKDREETDLFYNICMDIINCVQEKKMNMNEDYNFEENYT